MFNATRRGLSARQVRSLRRRIEADRCAVRPGLTHRWEETGSFDTWSGAVVETWTCSKCGKAENRFN